MYIEEVKGTVTEGFEDYDFTDSTTILEPINQKTARLYTGGDNNSYANSVSPLYGGTSVRLAERNNRGYDVLAKVDVNNYKFVKGRLYRVTFDFMNIDEVAKGGYFLLGTGKYSEVTKENSPIDVVAEWYERDDTFITKKSFTFLCEDDETTLVSASKTAALTL